MLDLASLWLGDISILPINLTYLIDEEKAAATASLGGILPLNDQYEKIISLEDVHRIGLTEEIKKIKQNPPKFNIPPILFRSNGLSLTP